jgi:hypothetical protein
LQLLEKSVAFDLGTTVTGKRFVLLLAVLHGLNLGKLALCELLVSDCVTLAVECQFNQLSG